MLVGFIDVASNKVDAYSLAQKASEELSPNISFTQLTSPDVLKIPATASKAFNLGADAVIIYLNMDTDDADSLDLVHEKLIDVEVKNAKYSYVTIVHQDEWSTPAELEAVTEKKLRAVLDLILKVDSTQPSAPKEGAVDLNSALGLGGEAVPSGIAPALDSQDSFSLDSPDNEPKSLF